MKKIVLFVSLCILLIGCNDNVDRIDIDTYAPDQKMIKVFKGGYEQEGFINYVNWIDENRYREIYMNGHIRRNIYEYDKDNLLLIRSNPTTIENLNDDRPDEAEFDSVEMNKILSTDNKWIRDEKEWRITNTNYTFESSIGRLETIEVTCQFSDDFTIKRYYAKGIGAVLEQHHTGGDTITYFEIDKIIYDTENYSSYEMVYRLIGHDQPTVMDFSSISIGTKQDDIHDRFGLPDGMLSGLYGDIYELENHTVIIYYDHDKASGFPVTEVKISEKEKEIK